VTGVQTCALPISWKKDDTVMGDESGVGYSSFIHRDDILGIEPLFKVSVSSINSFNNKTSSSFNNEALLMVQSFPSEIISYEKSPLLGVLFNKTVKSNYVLNKPEATIVSYPLYFSFSSLFNGIYSWYINDLKINTNLNEISFQKKTSNEKSRMMLEIKNQNSILQTRDVNYIIETI
jgi:hypothetical protein